MKTHRYGGFQEQRAQFLDFNTRPPSIKPSVEVVKFCIFWLFWTVIIWSILQPPMSDFTLALLIIPCVSFPFGFLSFLAFNKWRTDRELRELAYERWLEAVSENLRAWYDPAIRWMDGPFWRSAWKRDRSPRQAVVEFILQKKREGGENKSGQ